jgi:hypothetical protein
MLDFQIRFSNFAIIAILFLFLFFAIVPPIFSGLGIYRLRKKIYRRSSFIATCAIFSLILLSGYFERDEVNPFGAILFFTLPFSVPGMMMGSFYAAGLIGLIFTWFTVFGLVTTIQKRFGGEPW